MTILSFIYEHKDKYILNLINFIFGIIPKTATKLMFNYSNKEFFQFIFILHLDFNYNENKCKNGAKNIFQALQLPRKHSKFNPKAVEEH